SPGLFAACHVLHRLSVPRHPPDALASRLIIAPPPRTGPNPVPPRNSGERRSLMKTLLSDSQAKLCSPRLSASVTSQLSLHPSTSPTAVARGGVAQSSPSVARALRSYTPGRSAPAASPGAAPLHLSAAKLKL